MKILYFDTETTGTHPWKHSIIQISAIAEEDRELLGEITLPCRPLSNAEIEPRALEVVGVTQEEVMLWPDPAVQLEKLKKWLHRWVDPYKKGKDPRRDKFWPCAYNGNFDVQFLHAWFKRQGDDYCGSWHNGKILDPRWLAIFADFTGRLTLPDHKLGTVYQAMIGRELEGAHDAQADVQGLREIAHLFLDFFEHHRRKGEGIGEQTAKSETP